LGPGKSGESKRRREKKREGFRWKNINCENALPCSTSSNQKKEFPPNAEKKKKRAGQKKKVKRTSYPQSKSFRKKKKWARGRKRPYLHKGKKKSHLKPR